MAAPPSSASARALAAAVRQVRSGLVSMTDDAAFRRALVSLTHPSNAPSSSPTKNQNNRPARRPPRPRSRPAPRPRAPCRCSRPRAAATPGAQLLRGELKKRKEEHRHRSPPAPIHHPRRHRIDLDPY
jgi:hypothetical protein